MNLRLKGKTAEIMKDSWAPLNKNPAELVTGWAWIVG